MVRIAVEVCGEENSLTVMVYAASIRMAEEFARNRFPGADVRVVFPIDGESFFCGGAEGFAEGIEYDLPESIAG